MKRVSIRYDELPEHTRAMLEAVSRWAAEEYRLHGRIEAAVVGTESGEIAIGTTRELVARGKGESECIEQLEADIETMKEYLDLRRRLEDWHGVMDAAADIREMVAQLKVWEGA